MAGSLITFPLRLSVRGARAALRTTRDVADLGLAALELAGRALGEPPERAPTRGYEFRRSPEPAPTPASNGSGPPLTAEDLDEPDLVYVDGEAPDLVGEDPGHITEEVELVEEIADPGAEDGAGATIRVEPPLPNYDALRAADVIARVPGSDAATLAAIELYEHAHRRRRTVLDAVAREGRRRG